MYVYDVCAYCSYKHYRCWCRRLLVHFGYTRQYVKLVHKMKEFNIIE